MKTFARLTLSLIAAGLIVGCTPKPVKTVENLKAAYNGEDIRVCAVGGIRSEDKHTWQIAMRNR